MMKVWQSVSNNLDFVFQVDGEILFDIGAHEFGIVVNFGAGGTAEIDDIKGLIGGSRNAADGFALPAQ